MSPILAFATLMILSPAQERRECAHEAERAATLAVSAGDRLHVIARAGSLRVEGRPGVREVRVRARACASSADLLDQLTLETGRSGSEIRVEAAEVKDEGFRLFGRSYALLDMVLEIPEGMEARIEDGSGEAEIIGIGALRMEDGSGELILRGIRGSIDLEDGSGEVTIDGVEGNVTIVDGSGELDIRGVTGSVMVSDGSGSIHVADVGGDFTVRADGSGGIEHRDVRGNVSIPSKDRKRRARSL